MGIKHFNIFLRTHCNKSISHIRPNQQVPSKYIIDNLMIDMNGVFHASAQKIFKYGNHSQHVRLLQPVKKELKLSRRQEEKMFEDVCLTVLNVVNVTSPTTRVILCVDGVAPLGKQNQQRQRRYKSASESNGVKLFDSNSITPGTLFMHRLTKYVENYFEREMKTNSQLQSLELIFSNEKVPGEENINSSIIFDITDQKMKVIVFTR